MNRQVAGHVILQLVLAAVMILCWVAASARGEEPWGCYRIDPTRQVAQRGVLGELEARMPANHQYRSSDVGNWAHETTHARNARSRNQFGGWDKCNAAYMPGGRTLILPQPAVTLTEVMARSKQGPVYGKPCTLTLQEWDQQSFYLLDELSAYTCGTVVCIEYGEWFDAGVSLGHGEYVYGLCYDLAMICRERGYPHSKELNEFLGQVRGYFDQLRVRIEGRK